MSGAHYCDRFHFNVVRPSVCPSHPRTLLKSLYSKRWR